MNYAIIAAGEGSRLRNEGVNVPKPLVEVMGESLIVRMIRIFEQNHAESISIIINENMPVVKRIVDSLEVGCALTVVEASTESSMHSFYELSKVMERGPFCLTTVDTVFREEDFARFIEAFEMKQECDGLMLVTSFVDDEKPLYVEVDEDMIIVGFHDEGNCGTKYVSGGVYALREKAFDVLHDCIEGGVKRMRNYQRCMLTAGLRLKAYAVDKVVDIDHRGDIEVAQQFLQGGNQR